MSVYYENKSQLEKRRENLASYYFISHAVVNINISIAIKCGLMVTPKPVFLLIFFKVIK